MVVRSSTGWREANTSLLPATANRSPNFDLFAGARHQRKFSYDDGHGCRSSIPERCAPTSTLSSTPACDRVAMQGLLDTNTVILLPQLTDTAQLPDEPLISVITLTELSVGPLVASTDQERARRQAHLQQAEADFDPLPFDAAAARAFGAVAASLRRAGRKTAARAYDAMIAAIAISNDLPLFTCNPDDFADIDGLRVVAVPVPAT